MTTEQTRKEIAADRLVEQIASETLPVARKFAGSPVNDNRAANQARPSDAENARTALGHLIAVAWLAIMLGFVMQGLILAGKLSLGAKPALAQLIIDLAQGVTWSFFVCAGVGLGTTIAKARASLGGLVGLVSAPLALGLAKGSQKFMVSALETAQQPAVLSLATLGLLRALEYGVLGWILAWLVTRKEKHLTRFLVSGAAIGLSFGTGIASLTMFTASAKGTPLPAPQMLGTSINELVFPVGCAFVVYIALQVGRHVKLASDANT